MTAWKRLGLIHRSAGQRPWMATHAQMPIAELIDGSLYRVYFTCRDAANRSHIAWLVFDLEHPDKGVELSAEPLMAPGELGCFNDMGIMTSGMTVHDGQRRFYNIGWNVKTSVPMHTSIGLSTSKASGAPHITQRLKGPVFERNPASPYYVSCPWVAPSGKGWRMWYMSGLAWGEKDGKPASRYDVRHATSTDGVTWIADKGPPAIGLQHPGEMAIARPFVLLDGRDWRMWYCFRGENFDYRIGYAESDDGKTWTRRDNHELALPPSGDGFDSQMTCYPFVFDHGGERFMLYNGDAFGQAGLGLAQLGKVKR